MFIAGLSLPNLSNSTHQNFSFMKVKIETIFKQLSDHERFQITENDRAVFSVWQTVRKVILKWSYSKDILYAGYPACVMCKNLMWCNV